MKLIKNGEKNSDSRGTWIHEDPAPSLQHSILGKTNSGFSNRYLSYVESLRFVQSTQNKGISETRSVACTIKNMTILIENTSWSHTLESSVTLLMLSIMLLENIYSTGVPHDDHHMVIVICL